MSYIGQSPTNIAFVTDTFTGTGSTTAFTMSVAPASTTSVLVAITGVLQDPSTYSVSGTTLTFSAAPPSGTNNISVRYLGIPASGVTTTAYRTVTNFTATAGQTTFTPPSYTAGYIDVYRNGAKLALADFTATNGTTVVLNNACNAGEVVETDSFYVSSVLNAIPATAGAVNSTYIATGAVGSTQIAAGGVAQSNLASGVAGNGPLFLASVNSNTTCNNGAVTKITVASETYDTASCYDPSTSRFTPNVAGYYQVNGSVRANNAGAGEFVTCLRKNGNTFFNGSNSATTSANINISIASSVIYMNGTTDYLDLALYVSTTCTASDGSFSASFVRAA